MNEGMHAQGPGREKGEAGNCGTSDRSWIDQCCQQMVALMSSERGHAEHEDPGSMSQEGCCPQTSSHKDQSIEPTVEVEQ